MIGCSCINNINALNALNKYFARKKENLFGGFEETDFKVYFTPLFIKIMIDFLIFVIFGNSLLVYESLFFPNYRNNDLFLFGMFQTN